MGRIPVGLVPETSNFVKHNRGRLDKKKKSEIKLGDKYWVPTDAVKSDSVALDKFLWLIEMYKDFDFASSSDVDLICAWCLCVSDFEKLTSARSVLLEKVESKEIDHLEYCKEISMRNLDTMINKKIELMEKLGSKLYLTPASRVSGLPLDKIKKEKDEKRQSPLFKMGLLEVNG